jgi:hypothetical protein
LATCITVHNHSNTRHAIRVHRHANSDQYNILSALASQGCRVCFAYTIFLKHTLFWAILNWRRLQNMELHTQFWLSAHLELSFLANHMTVHHKMFQQPWQYGKQSHGQSNIDLQNVLQPWQHRDLRYSCNFDNMIQRCLCNYGNTVLACSCNHGSL